MSPTKQQLAKYLQTGFEHAITKSEFEKVFYGDKAVQDVMKKANMKKRKLFRLDKPLLAKETPINHSEL